MTKEDVERNKELIREVTGRMKIKPPRWGMESEKGEKRNVQFRRVKKEHNRIMYTLLEEIRPTLQKWMEEVEFCSRVSAFGTLDYLFKSEEVAFTSATPTIE